MPEEPQDYYFEEFMEERVSPTGSVCLPCLFRSTHRGREFGHMTWFLHVFLHLWNAVGKTAGHETWSSGHRSSRFECVCVCASAVVLVEEGTV